ncbi:MAG: T9SS type A sorting domain-containing protein, partial [Bacteroidetes bacterium]|nr:T9SS type A sorting domain-containing protein [Bacteroidota bacterium]
LFGSRLYISKQGPNTIGVINMDMIGYDSDGDYKVDLHVRNVANSPQLATNITSTNTIYALGVMVNVVNPGTDASDQYSFWEKGYSAIGLIENDVDFSPYYHKTTDQFNKMNTEYFFRCAKLGIGTLAALALPTTDGGTDVAALEETPKNFSLSQNYPNPFNPNTTINYSVSAVGRNSISTNKVVVMKVYDLLGREVATLVNEEKAAGNYQVKFDGTNMPSGVYFYRIQAADFIQMKKMILLK